MDQKYIRNFSIIAHIDHGKSTLADRLMEFTNTIDAREKKDQLLDSMDIERERGITIKAQTVRISYEANDGHTYELNLIDTPGHVDFSYEVSRSLAACEGALLVVDASQGPQAQTIANTYLALDLDLDLVPVLNKIDLPAADPYRVSEEMEDVIGLDMTEAIHASAKTGIGIKDILEAVVKKVPTPNGKPDAPLKAVIFDSWYDPYKGIIVLIRVIDGEINTGDDIIFMSNGNEYNIDEVGYFSPKPKVIGKLTAGEVGYITASIKTLKDVTIGDTVTLKANPTTDKFPGFKNIKPVVFCGLYPIDATDYALLRDSLGKLQLNDSAIHYEPESSNALGLGFRCGFLGLLHMEVAQERLEREFNLNLIMTAPSVVYKIRLKNGKEINIDNPSLMPEPTQIDEMQEPYISATIMVPTEYIGNVIQLLEDKRGEQQDLKYIGTSRAIIEYLVPMNEIVSDFYDKLKSNTKGYASFDYEIVGYRQSQLVKLDIMINKETVDALSVIVHKDKAYERGRALVDRLKEEIPRQMFEIAIQASIGMKVIASSKISAFRKNVTAKCYGGDISRKRKLLEKQKEGKKRMKQIGSVEIPQKAFLSVLSLGKDD